MTSNGQYSRSHDVKTESMAKQVLCPSVVRREQCKLSPCPFALHDERKTRIYVYSLPDNISKQALLDLFSRYGYVYKTLVKAGKSQKSNQDIGFVHFCSDHDAQRAIKEMNGTRPSNFSAPIYCRLADSQQQEKVQKPSIHRISCYTPSRPGLQETSYERSIDLSPNEKTRLLQWLYHF